MTIDEMIEVLQAAKRGEVIQARFIAAAEGRWCDAAGPVWDFDSYEYRIKPEEPREFFLWRTPYGQWQGHVLAAGRPCGCEYIKVREVLDDD